MAARKDSRIKTEHRKRIQTSMILNRLQDHILGKVEMSATQLRAAEVLLKKSLPDLRQIEHVGEDGHALPVFRISWDGESRDRRQADTETEAVRH